MVHWLRVGLAIGRLRVRFPPATSLCFGLKQANSLFIALLFKISCSAPYTGCRRGHEVRKSGHITSLNIVGVIIIIIIIATACELMMYVVMILEIQFNSWVGSNPV